MADGYWGLHQPLQSSMVGKRPRHDFDLPPGASSGQENFQYLPQEDNLSGFHPAKDTKSIEQSYERYLQNTQRPYYGLGEGSNCSGSGVGKGAGAGLPGHTGGMHTLPYLNSVMMSGLGPRAVGADMVTNGRGMDYIAKLSMDPMVRPEFPGREMPLPPDASNTIFVEGLPRDITQREVAHIFRPFLGYKEVRIVTKEPKYHSADRVVLCFVDFTNAASAMTAIDAIQGYKMDEKEPDSPVLRLQFSCYPGPRSGSRGRR